MNSFGYKPERRHIKQDNEKRLDQGFKCLKKDPQRAQKIAEEVLAQGANLSGRDVQKAYLLQVRAIFGLGRVDDCLNIFETMEQNRIPLNDGLWMAKGRVLQTMSRFKEALPIFKDLYYRSKDKSKIKVNGLALGRHYQYMERYQDGLKIFKKLRTDRSGDAGTHCNDKDIELTLGRQYQDMDQPQKALKIFKKLRTDRSGHEGTPCKDKKVELAIGDILIDLKNWDQFDQMQLDKKGFSGPEVDLSISVRYFTECIDFSKDQEISELLTKADRLLLDAIMHACYAIEKSQYFDASSYSQLAHCVRLLASLPVGKALNLFRDDKPGELLHTLFFTEAKKLAPKRQDRLKNEHWRRAEHDFLEKLSPDRQERLKNKLEKSRT